MTDKKTEALKLALKKAFDLGQRYWQQADSDSPSQWRKTYVTLASFNQLVEDTIREALAEQPAQQPAQQHPDLSHLRPETQEAFRGWLKDGTFVERAMGVMMDQERQLRAYKKAQQQEPCGWRMRHNGVWAYSFTKDAWDFIYAVSPAARKAARDNAPASKPLTDEQILNLVPGLQDCLCDPWDCNNSGDYYASIPKDMIRLARAIEAAHGIKEKNNG